MNLTPTRLDLLAAVARGRVYREAHQWWRGVQEVRITCRLKPLLDAHLVVAGREVRPGKVLAETTVAGRSALTRAGRCCRCGSDVLAVEACEHLVLPAGRGPWSGLIRTAGGGTWGSCADDCPMQVLCGPCWDALALGISPPPSLLLPVRQKPRGDDHEAC